MIRICLCLIWIIDFCFKFYSYMFQPYDVKSLQLVVYFPYKYPVRRMIVKVSEEQNLPPILAR